ncbi:MAG: phosphotransferase family protein [Thermoflexibacter sp.]|jgi:aminoglycoside phosphotransferase (APT) family kinase protein|nr:phosphotransferase family protein [Thermoflexibacter sp.]
MENQIGIDTPQGIRQGEELDIAKLKNFLNQEIPDLQGEISISQFPSGFSNLTYMVAVGTKEFVLRRPPFGANIKSAHDMQREYNILKNIAKAYNKVPQPLIYSNDISIIGAEFYMMERVKGVILRQKPPKGVTLTPALMRAISIATIDNLAEIHQIDIEKYKLKELGKPEGYVRRQVEGWTERYKKAETDTVNSMNETATWLLANLPMDNTPSLIHNDYKYDNIVLNPEKLDDIIAVLDWEMATIGDPLMDLGTTLGYWAQEGDPDLLKNFSLTSFAGNLSRQEVVERYAAQTNQNAQELLPKMVFYYAFGCFKIGVIIQQIYARYKKGFTQDQRFANLIYMVYACGQCAEKAIRSGQI